MKSTSIAIALAMSAAAGLAHAQGTVVYRCVGNAYTNDANEAKAKGCKALDGSNVTVIQGTKATSASGTRVASAASGQKVASEEQKARDTEARAILEAELKKAETRQAELLKEYNNGEPEMLGPEHKNHQKYLDRIAELKASIARGESDIASLRRELARVPAQ